MPDGTLKLVLGGTLRTATRNTKLRDASKLLIGTKDAAKRSGKGRVAGRRVYGADGRLKTIYTIDSGSGTFGSDLSYAFRKGVAKARKENKKKFGRADAVVEKH
jgi:hypothetical protein